MKLKTNSMAVVALMSGLVLNVSQGGGGWASIVPTSMQPIKLPSKPALTRL